MWRIHHRVQASFNKYLYAKGWCTFRAHPPKVHANFYIHACIHHSLKLGNNTASMRPLSRFSIPAPAPRIYTVSNSLQTRMPASIAGFLLRSAICCLTRYDPLKSFDTLREHSHAPRGIASRLYAVLLDGLAARGSACCGSCRRNCAAQRTPCRLSPQIYPRLGSECLTKSL